jgi:iron complex transport system ATP-binding protein
VPDAGAAVLTARGLGHRHDPARWLFRRVDLTTRPGSILAVLGPNGRGKTTLLRVLAGLIRPSEGAVEQSGNIAYVPSASASTFPYAVRVMVAMGRARRLGLFGTPSRADWDATDAALAAVGITALADRAIDRLSGGERQLALIARALTADAKCLLLDEPASALDLANQGAILRLVRRLADRDGLAIIMTTHHPQHALEAADEVLLMGGPDQIAVTSLDRALDPKRLSELYGLEVRLLPLAPVQVFGRRQ